MATSNATLSASFCSPNEGHATLTVAGIGSRTIETSELAGTPDMEDVLKAMVVLARFHVRNLSAANKKAAAGGGIAFTVVSTP